jgi:hypothetical protein
VLFQLKKCHLRHKVGVPSGRFSNVLSIRRPEHLGSTTCIHYDECKVRVNHQKENLLLGIATPAWNAIQFESGKRRNHNVSRQSSKAGDTKNRKGGRLFRAPVFRVGPIGHLTRGGMLQNYNIPCSLSTRQQSLWGCSCAHLHPIVALER